MNLDAHSAFTSGQITTTNSDQHQGLAPFSTVFRDPNIFSLTSNVIENQHLTANEDFNFNPARTQYWNGSRQSNILSEQSLMENQQTLAANKYLSILL